eukprot:ANDGO_07844.mRNA.1 hypothetical protein
MGNKESRPSMDAVNLNVRDEFPETSKHLQSILSESQSFVDEHLRILREHRSLQHENSKLREQLAKLEHENKKLKHSNAAMKVQLVNLQNHDVEDAASDAPASDESHVISTNLTISYAAIVNGSLGSLPSQVITRTARAMKSILGASTEVRFDDSMPDRSSPLVIVFFRKLGRVDCEFVKTLYDSYPAWVTRVFVLCHFSETDSREPYVTKELQKYDIRHFDFSFFDEQLLDSRQTTLECSNLADFISKRLQLKC